MSMNRGRLEGMAAPMEMLGPTLSNVTGRPVIDKTGLTGKYDFVLEWTPDAGADARAQGFGDGVTEPAPNAMVRYGGCFSGAKPKALIHCCTR